MPVIAPDGFMEAVGAESIPAGVPMRRRAMFQFGGSLAKGVRGHVDAGLGKGSGIGTHTLLPPTDLVREPVERRTIDGVVFVFQMAPETEAPAEMHFYLPVRRVLNTAESATWRSAYLLAAQELRQGVRPGRMSGALRADQLPALSTEVVFDWLAVRLDADRAAGRVWRIEWCFADTGETVAQLLENATLTQRIGRGHAAPDARVATTRAAFDRVVAGIVDVAGLLAEGAAAAEGDAALPDALFGLLDTFQPMFPVVTPE